MLATIDSLFQDIITTLEQHMIKWEIINNKLYAEDTHVALCNGQPVTKTKWQRVDDMTYGQLKAWLGY